MLRQAAGKVHVGEVLDAHLARYPVENGPVANINEILKP
jgi:hypothetical protein